MSLLYLIDLNGFNMLMEEYEPKEAVEYYLGYKLNKQDIITFQELQRETKLSEEFIKKIILSLEKN